MATPEISFPVDTLEQEEQQPPTEIVFLYPPAPEPPPVEKKPPEPVIVTYNKIVTLLYKGDSDPMTIYFGDKTRPEDNPKDLPPTIPVVTEEKPVGVALIGQLEGNTISYENRGQTEKAKILEVKDYIPLPKAV